MKHINFIKTVPLLKKREARLWIWLCIIIFTSLLSNIITSSSIQWYLYTALQKQKKELLAHLAPFETIIAQKKELLEEQQKIQKQIDQINRYTNNPKSPLSVLSIVRRVTQGIALQTIVITLQVFELHVLDATVHKISDCVKKLNEEPDLYNVTLVSLQTHQTRNQFIIKGRIAIKKS